MHDSSLALMGRELPRALQGRVGTVLDVGSLDINGSYRKTVEALGCSYVGLDQRPGPNVDIVATVQEYASRLDSSRFDAVISGQMLEHDPDPFGAVRAMASLVVPGGPVVLIAPAAQNLHSEPVDCWRFLPDGMASLLRHADLFIEGVGLGPPGPVQDCYGVGCRTYP